MPIAKAPISSTAKCILYYNDYNIPYDGSIAINNKIILIETTNFYINDNSAWII